MLASESCGRDPKQAQVIASEALTGVYAHRRFRMRFETVKLSPEGASEAGLVVVPVECLKLGRVGR